MFHIYAMNSLIQEQKICFHKFEKLLIRQFSCRKNNQTTKPSSWFSMITYNQEQPVFSAHKNLNNAYVKNNSLSFSKNFSTSNVTYTFMKTPNQDAEKRKNYIYFGVVTALCLLTFFITYNMDRHQDYVYIDIEPEEKKK